MERAAAPRADASPAPGARDRPAGVAVALRGVRRAFRTPAEGEVVALESVDLEVGPGEFVAILGPSGCGKSTLLRVVAGLERPDAGRVELGVGAAAAGARVAYVFQDAHLLPWRSVLGNVELPLELLGVAREARRAAALDAIEQVGLGDARRRLPAELSGGMRMRASLARALVTRPRLLLLDEPFAALDEITREGLDEELRSVWSASGMTVLFVTHSILEATFLAERAVVLTPRPARVALDRALELPARRTASLRTDPRFAAETRVLYDALGRGGDAR